MTLMTFEEEEMLHKVREIKPATDQLWEILHAVRRLETGMNEIKDSMNVPAQAPIASPPTPEPEV